MTFDGATYDPAHDAARLTTQLERVRHALLSDPGWWTLRQLTAVAGGSEASVSARLRDLRKEKFGSHNIERRRKVKGGGTYEYRLVVEPKKQGTLFETTLEEWRDG